jgi:Tol biopolymer transport system component
MSPKVWLLVAGAMFVLAGCDPQPETTNPPPVPQPPADVVSNKTPNPRPDRLLFSSGRDEPDLEVYSSFPDGSGRRRLTRNTSGDSGVVAYPNTGLVYYVCGRSESICVATTSGTGSAGVLTSQRIGFPIIEDPAISPDGSKMIFTGVHISPDGKSTNYDLYLYDFGTEEITNFAVGAALDQMPTWVSDTQVVWSRFRNGDWDLVTFALGAPRGSTPRVLTENDLDDLGADASSDGSKLAFISIRGNDGTLQTMPFPADGVGAPVALTSVRLERGFIGGDPDAAWSPDGTQIAFVSYPSGEDDAEIMTVPAAGGTPANATANDVYDVDPDWATLPPSFSIGSPLIVSEGRGAVLRFVIELDAPQTQTVSVDYSTVPGTATSGVDFTPRSGTARFNPGQTRVQVDVPVLDDALIEPMETVTLRLSNGSAGTLLANDEATGRIRDDEVEPTPTPTATPTPTPSPTTSVPPSSDGRIAFVSTRQGAQQLFTMKPDGTDTRHVSADQASSVLDVPNWSPNGQRLIYTALNSGQPEIVDRPADGSGGFRLLVVQPPHDIDPVYRPGSTGEAFVWSSNEHGDYDLFYATPSSFSSRRHLTTDTSFEIQPTFSADGTQLAYASDLDGDFDIYVVGMAANGSFSGTPVNVTQEASGAAEFDDLHPDFAPNANKIVFDSERSGNTDIYVVDVATKAQTRLTTDPSAQTDPTYSPAGTHLAFVGDVAGNLEIFTMPASAGATATNVSNNTSMDKSPDWGPTSSIPGAVAADLAEPVEGTSRTRIDPEGSATDAGAVLPLLVLGGLARLLSHRRH